VSEPIGKLGHLIVPVDDVAAAVDFYTNLLGCELRFRDGDRYAAVKAGELTIGLAGPGQQAPGGGIALSFEVEDLEGAARRLRDGGAQVSDPVEGPHEVRATYRDPAGNEGFLYSRL
jgi:predicted enzyme related to lactoylglutathione lyase